MKVYKPFAGIDVALQHAFVHKHDSHWLGDNNVYLLGQFELRVWDVMCTRSIHTSSHLPCKTVMTASSLLCRTSAWVSSRMEGWIPLHAPPSHWLQSHKHVWRLPIQGSHFNSISTAPEQQRKIKFQCPLPHRTQPCRHFKWVWLQYLAEEVFVIH